MQETLTWKQLLVENPMDVHFLLMKCLLTIHIACLHIPSAESGMRPRTGWTSTSPPRPVTTHTGRQPSTTPEGRPESPSEAGAAQGTDTSPFHGGFRGFTRRKNRKRGRVRHFGWFNSDTVSAYVSIMLIYFTLRLC